VRCLKKRCPEARLTALVGTKESGNSGSSYVMDRWTKEQGPWHPPNLASAGTKSHGTKKEQSKHSTVAHQGSAK